MFTFLKENFRPILLMLLALLIALLFWKFINKPAKDPVPSFQVSPGLIIVRPDNSLGADLVKITALDAQGALLSAGELSAPFDSFPIAFDKSIQLINVKMDYSLDGKSIGCPPLDETIIIPPVGVPIITTDVPMGRSDATPFSSAINWCDCNFNPITNCSPNNTEWRFSIGAGMGSAGKYKVEVRKETVSGGSTVTETSNFMLSIETPSALSTIVRFYTNAHMNCTGANTTLNTTAPLSSNASFFLQAFDREVFYNTVPLKYICNVQKIIDCTGMESDRIIYIKCDETPPPAGSTITYTVNVRRAATPATCGDGSTL